MSLMFQVIASGSKGNSILISSPRTHILLDAGLSAKELVHRLEKTSVSARQLDAVVVSHEHTDHVRGVGVLSRRFELVVHLSQGSLEGLDPQIGRLAGHRVFQPGRAFDIGDLRLHPFPISHDAREPSGFVVEHAGVKLGICTDLGIVTELVKTRLQGCSGLVIEANHDPDLLINGPYPWHLKQRIRSRHWHLSNFDSLELLKCLYNECLRSVVFAHLSETNNHPELVLENSRDLVNNPRWEKVRFQVGKQHDVTPPVELM